MKKCLATAFAIGTLLTHACIFATANDIVGYWKTIDDHTHQPKAVMQIYTQNNLIYGKVVRGYPINGVVPHETCPNCPAPFTNQPVNGMQVMWDLHYNPQTGDYEGGKILDPEAGHIYHVMLTPAKDGQSLQVRGYIGIPLIGRTQTWYRLASS